jgi:hypothetical protein
MGCVNITDWKNGIHSDDWGKKDFKENLKTEM